MIQNQASFSLSGFKKDFRAFLLFSAGMPDSNGESGGFAHGFLKKPAEAQGKFVHDPF